MKNIKLIGVLVILVLLYFGLDYFGGKSRSKSFRQTLVSIDTTKVNKIKITKGNEVVLINKTANAWKLDLEGGKKVTAKNSSISNALGTLLTIKPSRVVAKNEKKWNEFEVDSAGTRIEVFENGKNTLDIVLGKLGFKNPGGQMAQMQGRGRTQFYTHVRLTEDKEVYACDNFMSFSIPTNVKGYRDTELLQFNEDSISELSFIFPEDSSFNMKNTDNGWLIGNQLADSTKVKDFISGLKNTNAEDFADDVIDNSLGKETFSFLMNIKNQTEPIRIAAYKDASYDWIIYSSYNDEAYFADRGGKLVEKIFKGMSHFK